jgi:hypothetical protein
MSKVNTWDPTMVSPYTATGNSSKKGFGDVAFMAPVAAALGGQVGRIVAGPTGPIHQYYDTMLAGLLAGLAFNYAAVSSDGNNFAFKDPYNRFPKTQDAGGKNPAVAIKAGFPGGSSSYVRRGGEKGYCAIVELPKYDLHGSKNRRGHAWNMGHLGLFGLHGESLRGTTDQNSHSIQGHKIL